MPGSKRTCIWGNEPLLQPSGISKLRMFFQRFVTMNKKTNISYTATRKTEYFTFNVPYNVDCVVIDEYIFFKILYCIINHDKTWVFFVCKYIWSTKNIKIDVKIYVFLKTCSYIYTVLKHVDCLVVFFFFFFRAC